jgi:hypothetical protein
MPSSGMWRRVDLAATCSRWFLVHGFFYPLNGGDMLLRNVGSHKKYTAPHPKIRHSSLGILLEHVSYLVIIVCTLECEMRVCQ